MSIVSGLIAVGGMQKDKQQFFNYLLLNRYLKNDGSLIYFVRW